MHQRFGEAQVGGGADGKKFGETFDDAKQDRDQIIVQK
jgi:hypothetical protein